MNRRIFAPIDLQHTYFPEPYDEKISELHPRGYYRESSDAPPVDITEIDPSWGWAAGQLISTTSDLNQFLHALLDGRLLPAAQLDQMRTTVPAEETFGPDARYGLGLVKPSATVWRPVLEPRRQFPLDTRHAGALPTTDAKRTSRSACK